MSPATTIDASGASAARERASLQIGGICAVAGALAFGVVRLLHGDTPGADAAASLAFVTTRPLYAAMHIGAVFAALLTVAGLIGVAGSFTHPTAWALGRLGVASSLVGMAIFSVESTSEGLALPELAHAAAAAHDQQAGLTSAARAVLAVTQGPSLVAVAVLFGVTLLLLGVALVLDAYPTWLGWTGTVLGAITLIAATGQYLNPDLMPGYLIYGLLASVLAQLWMLALGLVMLRRAHLTRSTPQSP